MIDLIIFGMYGTLVGYNTLLVSRNGLYEFLQKHTDKKVVVATNNYSSLEIEEHLRVLGIRNHILKYYSWNDMIIVHGHSSKRKNLLGICQEMGVSPERAVLIVDNEKDIDDARIFHVPYVQVPYYEKKGEHFSFMQIDLDKRFSHLDLSKANVPKLQER